MCRGCIGCIYLCQMPTVFLQASQQQPQWDVLRNLLQLSTQREEKRTIITQCTPAMRVCVCDIDRAWTCTYSSIVDFPGCVCVSLLLLYLTSHHPQLRQNQVKFLLLKMEACPKYTHVQYMPVCKEAAKKQWVPLFCNNHWHTPKSCCLTTIHVVRMLKLGRKPRTS